MNSITNNILVTGVAGFIGSGIAERLLNAGHIVVGIDNFSDYYDQSLKRRRVDALLDHKNFSMKELDINNQQLLVKIFEKGGFDHVLHLAGQPGVRLPIEKYTSYFDANLSGFFNILNLSAIHKVKHFLYASSSSVYGNKLKPPYAESDVTDSPTSFYAATKKCNELMAYAYSNNTHMNTTGLRFFTVYGPWGRPDMAPISFTRSLLDGRPITLFDRGKLLRDFTYVEDVLECISRIIFLYNPASTIESASVGRHDIFNIGNSSPVTVADFIEVLERVSNLKFKILHKASHHSEVQQTWADSTKLSEKIGFAPNTSISEGINSLYKWVVQYYKY